MTELLSSQGVDIAQRNFQQIIIRGDGKNHFNQTINQQISVMPPSQNLEITINEKFMIAKNSFDQWSLVYFIEQDYKDILKFISDINSNDDILASDYSYGQVYFEISGRNRNEFLNKLTHFDLRLKKFPAFSMAQTLIAKIDCSIYNLKDRYIVTCNRSFEDYFKERLKDTAEIR
jgi:heterotetrameric sarcosine oxidase gamma subunit